MEIKLTPKKCMEARDRKRIEGLRLIGGTELQYKISKTFKIKGTEICNMF